MFVYWTETAAVYNAAAAFSGLDFTLKWAVLPSRRLVPQQPSKNSGFSCRQEHSLQEWHVLKCSFWVTNNLELDSNPIGGALAVWAGMLSWFPNSRDNNAAGLAGPLQARIRRPSAGCPATADVFQGSARPTKAQKTHTHHVSGLAWLSEEPAREWPCLTQRRRVSRICVW